MRRSGQFGYVAAFGAGAAVVLLTSMASPAHADAVAAPVTMVATDCTEVTTTLPIPIEQAAAALPAGYVPESLAGFTSSAPDLPGPGGLIVGTLDCRHGILDGADIGAFQESDRGIVVRARDNTPGLQLYTVDFLSTAPDLVHALDAAGFPARLTPNILATANGAGIAEGLTIQVGAPMSTPVPLPLATSWHGAAALRNNRLGYTASMGIGSATTSPGTPIAPLMAGTNGTGVGIIAHFDDTFTLTP
ncbi:hypothetical protein [Nocardia sp. NBC_00511]|uniref:hypothetical protein n=1 Tax=Nocardia sp. NBC_00511 TaxID=2903591 RepID=UPI0030DE3697